MALKTKTRNFYALIRHPFLAILLCLWLQKPKCFHDLIRTLFLVLLLRFSPQNQNGKFLCRDKIFAPCFFCLVYGYKIRNGNFLRLHKNCFLFFSFVYGFKNQSWKFLWFDKTFVSLYFLWF